MGPSPGSASWFNKRLQLGGSERHVLPCPEEGQNTGGSGNMECVLNTSPREVHDPIVPQGHPSNRQLKRTGK